MFSNINFDKDLNPFKIESSPANATITLKSNQAQSRL